MLLGINSSFKIKYIDLPRAVALLSVKVIIVLNNELRLAIAKKFTNIY